jgi:hypothetical protein
MLPLMPDESIVSFEDGGGRLTLDVAVSDTSIFEVENNSVDEGVASRRRCCWSSRSRSIIEDENVDAKIVVEGPASDGLEAENSTLLPVSDSIARSCTLKAVGQSDKGDGMDTPRR